MRKIILLIAFVTLTAFGCSQAAKSPVSLESEQNSFDSAPIIGMSEAGGSFSAIGVLGAYELSVNPETLEVSLISKRSSSIGESYIVGGVSYFTMRPCRDCLTIDTYSVGADGELVITLLLSHPFPVGDPEQPPSSLNRLDLDIFDVAAVLVPQLGAGLPTIFSLIGKGVYADFTYGQDGYTGELTNVLEEETAMMPYFLVIDESGSSTPTNNLFAMGTVDASFDIGLNLDYTVPAFDLFLTMAYGSSAKKAQRLEPKYFIPEFNRKAPWKIEVIPPDVSNTWEDDDAIARKNVFVNIYDWQHSSSVSNTVPYSDEQDTSKISAASSISIVKVEIPGMNNSAKSSLLPISGTGAADNPLVYRISINNQNKLPTGEYTSLVQVIDNRPPGLSIVGGETDTLVNSPDGILLDWYRIPEFTTYQTFTATVIPGCGPVTGQLDEPELANYTTVTGLSDKMILDIVVSATSAGDGNIVRFDADFNYDGVNFVSDVTTTDGDFTGVNGVLLDVPGDCESVTPWTFEIAFQATDDCIIPNSEIIAIYYGEVEYCPPDPVGDVSLVVNRGSLGSYGRPIDFAGNPFTLSWAAVPGAVQYAVYVDIDSGDLTDAGWTDALLTDDLTFVGATTGTSFDVPSSSIDPSELANHWVEGSTYVVRARSAMNVPATEATNSEIAWVTTNSWESYSSGVPGYGSNHGEGWEANCRYNTTSTTYNWYYTTSYRVWGTRSLRHPPYVGYYNNHYSGLTKQTPVFADQSVRHLSFCIYFANNSLPSPAGWCLGTVSTQPSYNWTTPTDFDWAQADSSGNYTGYNRNSTDVSSTFDGVGAGNNSWAYIGAGDRRFLVGGDVNNGGNSADEYVGMELCRLTNSYSSPSCAVDEFAIAVY